MCDTCNQATCTHGDSEEPSKVRGAAWNWRKRWKRDTKSCKYMKCAFSTFLDQTIQRVRQHVPQNKARVERIPEGLCDRGTKATLRGRLSAVEEIQLDREKIEHNPGLRALSKLMLNSFWGKYTFSTQFSNMHVYDEIVFFLSGKLHNVPTW